MTHTYWGIIVALAFLIVPFTVALYAAYRPKPSRKSLEARKHLEAYALELREKRKEREWRDD